jgi:hypothetical protein
VLIARALEVLIVMGSSYVRRRHQQRIALLIPGVSGHSRDLTLNLLYLFGVPRNLSHYPPRAARLP